MKGELYCGFKIVFNPARRDLDRRRLGEGVDLTLDHVSTVWEWDVTVFEGMPQLLRGGSTGTYIISRGGYIRIFVGVFPVSSVREVILLAVHREPPVKIDIY